MLVFDRTNKKLSKFDESSLNKEKLLERTDLQKAIVNSWDAFRNEIGFSSAILIGEEINPDNSTQDSLDILAFDSEDSSLLVIELKRDRNKLHLLQAISYAAMVSSKTKDEIIDISRKQNASEHEELVELLETTDISNDVKIILLAESYHPEVIITADWLKTYGVSIYAFALDVHTDGDKTYFHVDQRYPLKELTEVYESRKKTNSEKKLKSLTWNEVISSCEYSFAEKAIEMCLAFQEGDPSRKRFIHLLKGFCGFEALTFFFRRKHVNIYLTKGSEESFDDIIQKLPSNIQYGSWKHGFSIQINAEEDFKKFCELDSRLNY